MIEPMREPDYKGVGEWKAWRCPLEAQTQTAGVARWLLFCPGAHLGWSYWWIELIHLRPIPGARPAIVNRPGAQWEMICAAQNPDHEPDPDNGAGTVAWLEPFDWIVQFGDVADDTRAEQVGDLVVRTIMRGEVSPDSDFRRFWQETIPVTAQCVATGKHAPS